MDGRLSVNDRLSKYFATAPPDKADITLDQLLTHTAGLKDEFGGDYERLTREDFIAAVMQSKLLTRPGTRHRYSNAGYSLLAVVVERASGEPYEAYLRKHLWLPAGMEQTGYRFPKWRSKQVAHGYQGDRDWGTPLDKNWAPDGPYWNLYGNGGVLSTVWDLWRWHKALEGDTILSAKAKDKIYARRVKESPTSQSWYGYGWTLSDSPRGTKVIQHNGGNGIFYADFIRYIDDNIVIIAASNRSKDAEGGYLRGIREAIFR
jgi:CubicO group peptidase (beta-lactamase class C family)